MCRFAFLWPYHAQNSFEGGHFFLPVSFERFKRVPPFMEGIVRQSSAIVTMQWAVQLSGETKASQGRGGQTQQEKKTSAYCASSTMYYGQPTACIHCCCSVWFQMRLSISNRSINHLPSLIVFRMCSQHRRMDSKPCSLGCTTQVTRLMSLEGNALPLLHISPASKDAMTAT